MGVTDAEPMSRIQPRPAADVRPNTLLIDPANPAHAALAEQLPTWRAVPATEAVGLDFVDAERVCVADWRLFDHLEHLRERMMLDRGAIIVVVGLSEADQPDKAGLVSLRHYAGEVVALADATDLLWTSRLMVPVTTVGSDGVAFAIEQATSRQPQDRGTVEVHLREALSYVRRNDDTGAFLAAARALAMAPDQPGIVADVARLLARMGRSAEGEKLCKVFLLQRPDSHAVQQALTELDPIGS